MNLLALFAVGCAPETAELDVTTMVATDRQARLTLSGGETALARTNLQSVEVELRAEGGDWVAAQGLAYENQSTEPNRVVVVADNSQSEGAYEVLIRDAVTDFGATVLGGDENNAAGIVRVSTNAGVWQGLTEDSTEFDGAAGELFINGGWTALWDGVRMGHEMLNDAAAPTNGDMCLNQARSSMVVFTDAGDNNSSDEQAYNHDLYPGDGVDTTLDMLLGLEINGWPVPTHTVAVGNLVSADNLANLSASSGALTMDIDSYGELASAMNRAADMIADDLPVCITTNACSYDEARITVETTDGDVFTTDVDLPALCDGGRYEWVEMGLGSASGTTVATSLGGAPDASLCNAEMAGKASVCGSSSCTYMDASAQSCGSGADTVYACVRY